MMGTYLYSHHLVLLVAYDLPGDRGTVKSMLKVYPKRLTLTASSSIDLSFHDIESLKLMSVRRTIGTSISEISPRIFNHRMARSFQTRVLFLYRYFREKLCRIRIHNMFPDITIINKHAQIWAGSLADCASYNLKESSKLKLDVANCSNVETLRGFSCSL